MVDSFSETTSESWFSRIIGSIKSVLVGLVLFVVAFPVLFFNEGRAVKTAKSLEEGAGAVVSVASASVDRGNEGRLVHTSGEAKTTETLTDDEFGVSVSALKLIRSVEMYQWQEDKKSETKNKLGGGTETVTTYDYSKGWSSSVVDSGSFQRPEGHENPGAFPVEAKTVTASNVTLGAYRLPEAVLGQLNRSQDVPPQADTLPEAMSGRAQVAGSAYYLGADPASPAVGDVRVTFKAVPPATVSLVARQAADTFEPYQTKAGDALLLVEYGTVSADAMFKAAEAANTMLTWILRFVGFFVMFLGLTMVFRPVAVFADVIPLFGTLLGAGIGIFSALSALAMSLATIAFAWLFFRPLLAVGLLVVALAGVAGLVMLGVKRKQARAVAARGAAA